MSVTQNFFLTFYNRRKNHYSFLSILNYVNYSEFFSYFFIITEKNLLLLSFYFSFPFLLPSLSCPSLPPSLSLPPLSLPQQRHERTRSWGEPRRLKRHRHAIKSTEKKPSADKADGETTAKQHDSKELTRVATRAAMAVVEAPETVAALRNYGSN